MNITKWKDSAWKDLSLKYNSESTIKNYHSCIIQFLHHFKNEVDPQHISTNNIKKWLLDAKTINTRKHRLNAIRFFYLVTVGMKNKVHSIPYPKSEKKLPIVLSQSEVQRMFDVCDNLKHRVMFSILYACGLRVSELINLKWQHIDRSRLIINILQAKGKKDRQVPLPVVLIPLLEKYYREYKSVEYVLNGQTELQYSERSVGEVIKQLAQKAGISKRVYTHLIRHCCFTHLLEAGTDLSIIQKIAGHNNPKTTLVYTHISHNLISTTKTPLDSIEL